MEEVAAEKIKFDWKENMQQILIKKENRMTLNKLRKKTVKKYFIENPAGPKTKDEVNQKFDKKIHKIKKLRIVGEEVFLDVDNTESIDVQSSEEKQNSPSEQYKNKTSTEQFNTKSVKKSDE